MLKIDFKKFIDKERFKIVCCYVEYFSGIECVLIGKDVFKKESYVDDKKRVEVMVNNIRDENEFLFLVIIDLICKNGRLRFLILFYLIWKYGFLYIVVRSFDCWLWDDDINEKRSFCIFIFVVFFGGKVVFIDFESYIMSFFFVKIC